MPVRLVFAVLLLCAGAANAAWPEKSIRFVVPGATGGAPDVLMRILVAELSRQMGVAFVIENKPGALGTLGTLDVVRAAPDGYTLGYGNIVPLAVAPSLLDRMPYDIDKDLTLVSNTLRVANLLAISPDLPVKDIAELVAYAKKNPGKLTMGSAGNGTTSHLSGELFKAMTGVFILHVPYRGSVPAINDLAAGRVQLMFDNISSIAPYAKSNRVRGIAVTSARRSPVFPDLPTVAEAGLKGYETVAWGGVVGPAGLPRDIVTRLHAEIKKALASPALLERYRNLDTEVDGGTSEEFRALVRGETVKWAAVIKRAAIKVD